LKLETANNLETILFPTAMGLDKPLQTVVVVFFFGCSSPPPIPKAIIQLMQTTNCDRSK